MPSYNSNVKYIVTKNNQKSMNKFLMVNATGSYMLLDWKIVLIAW